MNHENRLSPAAKMDIQGFITSAYGHLPFTLTYSWRSRTAQGAGLAPVSPAAPDHSGLLACPSRYTKERPERTLNIAITYAGLAALGVSEIGLHTFPAEFREGMASAERTRILGDSGDSDPAHWEVGGPQNEMLHLVLILNAPTSQALDEFCSEERQAVHATQGGLLEHESCAQNGYRPESGQEHFGFFDGVAQPQILGIKGKGLPPVSSSSDI